VQPPGSRPVYGACAAVRSAGARTAGPSFETAFPLLIIDTSTPETQPPSLAAMRPWMASRRSVTACRLHDIISIQCHVAAALTPAPSITYNVMIVINIPTGPL